MAGDWIKMRTDLYRDPKVCEMASRLASQSVTGDASRNVTRYVTGDVTRNVTRNAVVGALVSVWGIMRHRGRRVGDDLEVRGCTILTVDDIAELPGFGEAMASVGWLAAVDEGIKLPNFFEEFNVEPAQERASKSAERQRRYRERREAQQSVTRDVTRNVTRVTKSNAREEKSRVEKKREEKNTHSESVDQIYAAYPKKVGKPDAIRAIVKSLSKIDAAALLALTERYAEAVAGSDPQFIPNPATWFNQERWADDPATWQRSSGTTRQPDLFSGIMAACEGNNAT